MGPLPARVARGDDGQPVAEREGVGAVLVKGDGPVAGVAAVAQDGSAEAAARGPPASRQRVRLRRR